MTLSRIPQFISGCLVALVAVQAVCGAEPKGATVSDPASADADFALQGEYVGDLKTPNGTKRFGFQVIALGKGQFRLVNHTGGLPGDGWDRGEKKQFEGQLADGKVTFKNDFGVGTLQDGKVTVINKDGETAGTFKKVMRQSATLGAKPPKDAVVLFDGSSADNFNGKISDDGLLMQGATSKQAFGDHSLHLEFRVPYMPAARGQGRGNSGLYVQGRYEIQMLDSFGLSGEWNECGGIYGIAKPAENMCYPPLSWQTYDVDFTAARYKEGKKTENARVTVRHNGVVIHDDLELPKGTAGGPLGEGEGPGPIFLQDHGNPVRYQNIWVVKK